MKHRNTLLIVLFWLALPFCGNSSDVITQNFNHFQNSDEGKMKKSKIVFLITKDTLNYEADKTVPVFAEMLRRKYGHDITVLLGTGANGSYQYPNIEAISKADLLVVFARRIALPHAQMKVIKTYLEKGKPLIGIRTANHAFSVMSKIEKGYEDWKEFVPEILGCNNLGYGPVEPGTDVSVVPGNEHPVLKNVKPAQWHSNGNVYLVTPLLDEAADILLYGKVGERTEPVAWTRTAGSSKVFYTSLGYPDDFKTPQFITLLVNAIQWTLTNKPK